ncbi:MAG: hypothetical protein KGL39_19275 [Patescibacteria group bacterium]|nr:hypothetical protein [Patescibacteria group bacterium]
MKLIRPDAAEKLSEAITLTAMILDTESSIMREQHVRRIQVLLDMLLGSIRESDG